MLFAELIERGRDIRPAGAALCDGDASLTYDELSAQVAAVSAGLGELGLRKRDRVAVWLPKCVPAVVALFAAARAGGVFVPVNPVLKPRQAMHILRDSGARVLITTADRLASLRAYATDLPGHVVLTDSSGDGAVAWADLMAGEASGPASLSDDDLAALLYTSGSTGSPKGVMLSHRNLTLGAESVATYLGNTADDRILGVLPLSFDYGLSQVTTAFWSGATAVLINHLFPQDIVSALARHRITGLGCVPPLWFQLLDMDWPEEIAASMRYVTNSGGHLPRRTVEQLRTRLPSTDLFLMYGLTEAFRSTFLPPAELGSRPNSIGKAIPHVRIDIVNEEGEAASAGEHGELVHSGPLVAKGYWNDPERTRERFRPLPRAFGVEGQAVWSGDAVYADEDGFLYFVERRDNMIKTSGYRVSPTEVEDVLLDVAGVREAVAIGVPHESLGQAVVAVIAPRDPDLDSQDVLDHCRQQLPSYMIPRMIILRDPLPRTPNGKIDRAGLAMELGTLYAGDARD